MCKGARRLSQEQLKEALATDCDDTNYAGLGEPGSNREWGFPESPGPPQPQDGGTAGYQAASLPSLVSDIDQRVLAHLFRDVFPFVVCVAMLT